MQLTAKETELIKDLKDQEKLCIEKYKKYSNNANDGQLKNLLTVISGIESNHLKILDDITSGKEPTLTGGGTSLPSGFTTTYTCTDCPEKQNDSYLCSDLLATEKHVSALYDTCIFEFTQDSLRNALNKIQKDEQEHGKKLYDYMSTNNMYC